MTLKPILDRLVVVREEAKTKTEGGLYLPEQAKEAPHRGTVVAAGKGKYVGSVFVENTVKKGDRILFANFAGTEIKREDKTYLVLSEPDVLAIIE